MKIEFLEPLQRGWNRMEQSLFHPFNINKWFTVGFTAFLASLTDCGHGGSGGSDRYGRDRIDWEEFGEFPYMAWQWLMENILWFTLILLGVFVMIVLGVVLTWLSSRGKFMFLDNVIYNKAEVKKPWNEYSYEGDSLFVWRVVYGFVVFVLFILFVVFAFLSVRNMLYEDYSFSGKIWTGFGLGLELLIFLIIISYISLFLNDFVVPIMYKYRVSAYRGWGIFFKSLNQHPGKFLLYGLFVFVLVLMVVVAVIAFGLFTCCIGFVLLIIPYIGAVVMLPVSWTFRAYSLEFLEQFDDDLKFFPDSTNDDEKVTTI